MELKHFKLVRSIVEHGSLTKASKALFLSQSALSHQLRELEMELGEQVFIRNGNSMELTPVGKIILEESNQILNQISSLEFKIRQHRNKKHDIQVGMETFTCYHWLPGAMKQFKEKFVGQGINVQPVSSKNVVESLENGSLDLVISNTLVRRDLIENIELFCDERVLVYPKDHRVAEQKNIQTSLLNNYSLIIHSHGDDKPFRNIEGVKVESSEVLRAPTTQLILEMINESLGVSILPKWAISPYLDSYKNILIKSLTEPSDCKWYVNVSSGKKHIDSIEYLIRILKQTSLLQFAA